MSELYDVLARLQAWQSELKGSERAITGDELAKILGDIVEAATPEPTAEQKRKANYEDPNL